MRADSEGTTTQKFHHIRRPLSAYAFCGIPAAEPACNCGLYRGCGVSARAREGGEGGVRQAEGGGCGMRAQAEA